jgi:hypothetical protein
MQYHQHSFYPYPYAPQNMPQYYNDEEQKASGRQKSSTRRI